MTLDGEASAGPHEHGPTAKSRRLVEAMAALFLPHEGIGAILGIPGDALRRRYPGELARGRALGELAIASGLRRRMEKGNAAALIYMAKAKLGWPEKPKEEHADSGGDDATRRYLAMPQSERLAHLRVLAARVLGPAPDPEADGFERG